MATVHAVWKHTLYESENGYTVARYSAIDSGTQFSATGYFLPQDKTYKVNLIGEWETTVRYGTSFKVEQFDIELPTDKDGAVAYLRSLKCGIGESAAAILYEKFGDQLWHVIETEPERIKATKGCRRVNVDKLVERYNNTLQMRNLMALFQTSEPGDIRKIQSMAQHLGNDAVGKIQRNPYLICEYGFSFSDADRLAQKIAFDRTRPERIAAAVNAALRKAERDGHLYLPISQLSAEVQLIISENAETLDTSSANIRNTIAYLADKNILTSDNGAVYRTFRYKEECQIAADLVRLAAARKSKTSKLLPAYIQRYEKENLITLDPQQKKAIVESFDSCAHIITGGPGTGKTTILKCILYCHEALAAELKFEAKPLLMAPTGRAARRMSEATGRDATTIHKAMGLLAETQQEDLLLTNVTLDASIVIVDEASMLDSHLAAALFHAIPSGTQLILVGDVDQLPSVGCGNVLREAINSQCIPVTRLLTIFRQEEGNSIVSNAKLIRDGSANLTWDDSFAFVYAPSVDNVYTAACNLYTKCVQKYGMDKVILLNPYRNKGLVSAAAFNNKLQERLNPAKPEQLEIKVGATSFRAGDRVMQTVNTNEVSNGDVGCILKIVHQYDDNGKAIPVCVISFQDITVHYTKKEMANVVLAYCTTVHKSQGSEYDTAILVLHDSQQNMLRRNLLYTGVTRAAKRVAIVGSPNALVQAIETDVVDHRNTKLSSRIRMARKSNKPQTGIGPLLSSIFKFCFLGNSMKSAI
jgi:exodeoxyribonuclease V alpha subunit